jgi:hypothetical protein
MYVSEFQGEQGPRINLQLESNGRGSWTSEDDRIEFKWEAAGEEIRLHTRSGGIIQGKLSQSGIEFVIPASDVIFFKKVTTR